MEIFGTIIKATALLLVLIAAFEDFRHLRIRNDICIAVAALFIPFAFTLSLHDVGMHVISAAIIFAVTATMFFMRLFGGGDAKLLAALALWFLPSGLPAFLMVMALTGGVIGVIALVLKKSGVLLKLSPRFPKLIQPEDGWFAALARGETVVPYGLAIAFAAAVTFF